MNVEESRVMPMVGGWPQDQPCQEVVRLEGREDMDVLVCAIRDRGWRSLAFESPEFFADAGRIAALCRVLVRSKVNVLWSASLAAVPERDQLRTMRLAGCRWLDVRLGPDEAVRILEPARELGFGMRLSDVDGRAYSLDRLVYTVVEREAVADRLPGLHAAQYELAVAYFRARRYGEVMRPLGKAMVLGFPLNDLCLNLLACLSAARQYPEMAAGLLAQAGHGCLHPVVFWNRELLRSWMEGGGDVRGVRLELEPTAEALPS
jgi:hypothetical protein